MINLEEIKIKRSERRKRIALSIDSGVITLHLPLNYPKSNIQQFLETNQSIIDDLKAREERLTTAYTPQYVIDSTLPMLGKHCPIKSDSTIPMPCFESECFKVKANSGERLKREIEFIYKNHAATILSRKLFSLSQRYKIAYTSININSANTRWGSCCSTGVINFSWKLILCPEPLVDYVVAHELAHRVELNHSSRFWQQVSIMNPNYKKNRAALKEEAIRYRSWK